MVYGLGKINGLWFMVWGDLWFMVYGLGRFMIFMVYGLWFGEI
jgi:hypothetical protein